MGAIKRTCASIACALACALLMAARASAQLPNASGRALGLGENYTAAARGYAALAWNPALLAIDAPHHSMTLLPVRGVAGLAPITLSDLSDWQGRSLPTSVREGWLRAIESSGGQQGAAGGDATYIAAQLGRFGFQASTSVRAIGDLTPGAAELLFFGNAGRTGAARQLEVGGSELHAHAASTIALSYALPLPRRFMRDASMGVTAKYTIGHMLMLGHGAGNTAAEDAAIDVFFPLVGTPDGKFNASAGGGLGFDIGFAKRSGKVTVGATLQNAINTFAWDVSKLEYRKSLAEFDGENSSAGFFDVESYDNAPAEVKQAVRDARFARVLATGASMQVSPRWSVASDLRVRIGRTTLAESASFHLGAGGEYRLHERVALRAGSALIEDGFQVGGGVGVRAGPTNLSVSVMRRSTDLGSGTVTIVSLFSTLFE
jgi:hypothetical protein